MADTTIKLVLPTGPALLNALMQQVIAAARTSNRDSIAIAVPPMRALSNIVVNEAGIIPIRIDTTVGG